MRTFNKHPQWYNVPMRLNEAETQNPAIVLDEFFQCFHLNEARETLWNWMVEVVSSPHGISHDHHDRNNHIFFYEKIETLVEAAFLIQRRIQKHLRKRSRRQKKS